MPRRTLRRPQSTTPPQIGDVIGTERCAVCGRRIVDRLFDGYSGPFRRIKHSADFLAGSKLIRSDDRTRSHEWRCPEHVPDTNAK